MESVAAANEEATDAWNGPLFDRWIQYRDIVGDGLASHGEAAIAKHTPADGGRVLDIGCGLGDTTLRLASLVGPEGEVVGIDVAERMIATARADAEAAGATNVSFIAADVQIAEIGDGFDLAFSRMGTMFFANPVAAMRNIRNALVPGGQLCMVVWRQKPDNDWLYRAELTVKDYLEKDETSDEPTCGPGPFSMAGADTTSGILVSAGFDEVELMRCDIPIRIGSDLDQAVDFVMALGPAAEVLRLAGSEAEEIRPTIERDLREALAEFSGEDGVTAAASTWVVSARNPG